MIGGLRISLSALRANAERLRDLVSPSAAAFVVKGNAYGHGLVDVALAIEGAAEKFCVFSLDEAVALRDGGITKPILVLGPVAPDALDDAMQANVETTLWSMSEYVRKLTSAAQRAHKRAKVHIKINTGLNRLGLEPNELADAIEDYARMSDLQIVGVFSHLASAEEIDSPYTMLQLERFQSAYAQAEPILAAHGPLPTRHIAASAAGILWPQTRLDMVRFGIALYGLWPSPQTREAMDGAGFPLQPALSYVSKLITTRQLAAGEPIGYGTTFHAPRAMRIGVVPLGYADGIPRAFSNTGAFLVDGARAPIVGRVAMNLTVVDLTNAPKARAGAPVTLIGRDGEAEIAADDWAAWASTINYEIVTRLPNSLGREYVL